MWGKETLVTDGALDMAPGLLANTLGWTGLNGAPADEMLTIVVTGTVDKPKIDCKK